MTLSSFNQEGGKVTGNIKNLTIESKQIYLQQKEVQKVEV